MKAKKDSEANAMLNAAGAYLRSIGWTSLMIAPQNIQATGAAHVYDLVLRFTGAPPSPKAGLKQ